MPSVEDFAEAVEEGLKLAKRIYFGRDRSVAPPSIAMSRSARSHLPTAPMVYAVVADPGIVDNPDMPSYQPYVHGRCEPPALIPLQMNGIVLEADCYLDTAFVTVSGSWRVHCVMGSKSCDCRFAIPMGEHGSILGVEVDTPIKSYHTQLIKRGAEEDEDKGYKFGDSAYLTPNIFILSIPQVDGGSNISITVRWSQKILYDDGDFSLSIPFNFPEYVTPAGKKIPKREKIKLSINAGDGNELLLNTNSHPLKEQKRQVGNLSFIYEADVLSWSSTDFTFSYNVPTSYISGNVLLKSPSVEDVDQREMFAVHILPGSQQKEALKREIVYVVDISGSMEGKPLEDTKAALSKALSQLHPEDSFNIVAFNGETFLYSSKLKPASQETVEEAIQWIGMNFVAGDGTNILLALTQAIEMLSNIQDSIPMIFLLTDGSVANERQICDTVRSSLSNCKSISPRVHTFGIGTFCNLYFLQMLAIIGKGYHDAAYETDIIESRLGKFFSQASSTIFANITIEQLNELGDVEVYPTQIPDLSSESPLSISGRYRGNFPEVVRAKGIVAGMKNLLIDLKVQKTMEVHLDKVVAMQQIATYTAQAWLSQDKQIEEKAAELSIVNGVVCEYTLMSVVETQKLKANGEGGKKKQQDPSKADKQKEISRRIMLKRLGLGFGNLKATEENASPGYAKAHKHNEAAEIIVKAASNCCSKVCGYCCCMCCIQACNKISNQAAVVLAQIFGAFACLGCIECCADICCAGND